MRGAGRHKPYAAVCLLIVVQVHTLLKGLEKIAASADIPMLVAGDFNSVPGSPAHALLTKGKVRRTGWVGSRACSWV